jgi:alpha-glucosidase
MESALEDYPGMHLEAAGEQSLTAVFPPAALEEDTHDVRDVSVARRAPYLARTVGTREFPWRVLAIAPDDRALLENQLVYRLAPDLRLQDTSWIRPGKVAWDWWNDRNFHGVDFPAGVNQRTYEEYVNFAQEYGIPYVILDEGWSPLDSLMTPVPSMDVAALARYAGARGVGLILWALWKPLDDRMDEILDRWQQWGVRGVKVDFMQRDDQAVVRFYWRMAREAAARHMVVDFHGAYKPAGLRRAYPNVLTREGVRGLEADKWSADITPDHDVTLPFTRMLAGPMDYTPGAMINAARQEFRPVFSHPMSQGTRAHQMALYVVYESPLQMLADNPQHYRREPDVTRFIVAVPTTWDETRPLLGKIGDYVAIARRKGDTWWVGALTDWEPRTLSLDLTFLGDRPYQMELYRDGINAARHGSDYVRDVRALDARTPLEVHLAPGGGWVARLTPGRP